VEGAEKGGLVVAADAVVHIVQRILS